jgi:hypothetical protein
MADKHHETQEQSIKARKHQLFEPDAPAFEVGSGRSFKDFVRTTPATPMSGLTRAALWAAGVIVALVLVAAMIKTFHRPPQIAPRPARRAAGAGRPDRRDGVVKVLRNGPGRLQPGAGDSIVKDCTGPRPSSPSTKVSV